MSGANPDFIINVWIAIKSEIKGPRGGLTQASPAFVTSRPHSFTDVHSWGREDLNPGPRAPQARIIPS